MPKIAIIVEFDTVSGRLSEVEALLREHAAKTLAEESGCLRFEVLRPVERDGRAIADKLAVSELYADRAAVAVHESSPRLPKLREAYGPLLTGRRLLMAEVD
ncbi:MAG TPA: putative quinol monooxygenase [Aliidongia sp.]|nr:putative quinol monooxygenase [Aliidongia sp.]